MLQDLATPPMIGEIISHTLTLSDRVMVSHYPRDGWVGKVLLSFRAVVSMPDLISIGAFAYCHVRINCKYGYRVARTNLESRKLPDRTINKIESNNLYLRRSSRAHLHMHLPSLKSLSTPSLRKRLEAAA